MDVCHCSWWWSREGDREILWHIFFRSCCYCGCGSGWSLPCCHFTHTSYDFEWVLVGKKSENTKQWRLTVDIKHSKLITQLLLRTDTHTQKHVLFLLAKSNERLSELCIQLYSKFDTLPSLFLSLGKEHTLSLFISMLVWPPSLLSCHHAEVYMLLW